MAQYIFQSQTGYKVLLESEDLPADTVLDSHLMGAYLPGVNLTDDKTNVDLNVRYVESSEKNLTFENNLLVINDLWSGKVSLDVWHLLYSIFRLDFINHRFYPIHASCLGAEKYTLLVGHSGMGKTTLTLRLLNDFGWKIYSGNKTFVDFSHGLEAVAGTKTISIRSADSHKYPHLFEKESVFSDRTAFDLPSSFLSPLVSPKISSIFQVRIDDGQDQISELHHPSTLHTLYPFFLDSIYADTVLCDGNGVFSGNIDHSAKDYLAASLSKSLQNIKIYSLKGSVNFMVGQIKDLI